MFYNVEIPEETSFNSICRTYSTGGVREFREIPKLENIQIKFYGKTTVVFWGDKSKTVVRQNDEDSYDKEKAIAMCFMKKYLGNTGKYNNVFKKFINEEN